MAHAWKACWVQALGGSNPPSSASKWRRPAKKDGKSPLSAFSQRKVAVQPQPHNPAEYRRAPPNTPRRGTFGGTISRREGVFFTRRYCTVSLMQFLAVSRTPFLGICRLHLPDAAKALSMRGITPFEQRDVGLSKVNGLGHATTHH